ncbi:phage tail tape measure protein [Brachybacterium sp. YJGR34]|uniref:phage tail tape measure protein n=1 Tax=Brachybacterium sp. YJGR34 TaxID=2059911 RepID=UPI000E09F219|nr:phage tail tape measure protein [Brachybacterium sp. YJGR34]
MASKSAILAVKIIGDASNAIGSMGKAGLAVTGLGAAAVAAGALVGKALYDIGAAATDMDNTIRIGTGATGEALTGMQDTARDIAKQVPDSLGDVGTAVADLNTNLGLTGPVLDTVGRQVLEAGRMLGEDIDIKNAASTLNGFNTTAEDTPEAMDNIFRVSQATGTSMNELTGQLSTQSGVLNELGLGLGDSAALIGGLSKAGIDSNAVLKGMGRSMTDLARDGEPTADTFNRVMGELQGFIDTGDTAAAMDLAGDLFGTRAAPQFISALQSGVLNMDDLMGATGATQDTILGLAEETRTAGEQWGILKNNAMLALEPIGTVIFGLVGDALGALAAWISTIDFSPIQAFADQIGPVLGEVAGQLGSQILPILEQVGPMLTQAAEGGVPFQGMLASVLPHLQGIGDALLGIVPTLLETGATILPLIIGAVTTMVPLIAQAAGTILPAVLGIVQQLLPILANVAQAVIPAVVGAVQTLIPTILQIVPPIVSIVQTIIGVLGPAIEWLLPLVTGIFGGLVTQIQGAIQIITGVLTTVAALLRGDFAGAWEGIKGIVSGAITFVRGVIDQGMSVIASLTGQTIENVKSTFQTGFTNVVSTVQTKASDLIGEVKALPGKITDALGNLGSLLTQAGKDLIQGMINGIGSMGQALREKASGLAGGAVESIKSKLGIASPSKVLREIGVWTGEGFVEGVDKMQRGAAGAMSDLVQPPEPPRIPVSLEGRRTAAGPGTATAPVRVEINFTGLVTDRLGVAREIRRVLDEYGLVMGEVAA